MAVTAKMVENPDGTNSVHMELSEEEFDLLWMLAYNVASNAEGSIDGSWVKQGFSPWPSGLDHPGDERDATLDFLQAIIHTDKEW